MKGVKLILTFIMVAALVAFPGCSDQGTTGEQGQKTMEKRPNMPSADDTPQEKAVVLEVSGILEQSDNGIMLVSEGEKYLVTGQDLTEMVGKEVTIKGEVDESGVQKKIMVDTITVAK